MQTQTPLFMNTVEPTTVKETVDRILITGKITRADQQVFMKALLSQESLTEEEQIHINWVFDGLRRGALQVVN